MKFGDFLTAATVVLFWVLSGEKIVESDTIFRLVAILCTSLVILTSSFTDNKLLSIRWLVYMGDISYVLYLFHWPVIVLFHMLSFSLNSTGVVACIAISLAVSVFLHHTHDKPPLALSFGFVF
ncbi:hypothetical protein PENTCL1PPCAC_29497, partial [Pristionchus entomophagus]